MRKFGFYSQALLFFISLILSGCTVKLVADYDVVVAQDIINASKKVDRFYGELIETADSLRTYERFKSKYIDIEVDIRSLTLRNRVRPLNENSSAISETVLSKWLKYKNHHREKNTYKTSLAENHRERFTRLFLAMTIAEEAKKMNSKSTNNLGGEE